MILLFFNDNFERNPNKQNLLVITKRNKLETYSAKILAKKRKGEKKKKKYNATQVTVDPTERRGNSKNTTTNKDAGVHSVQKKEITPYKERIARGKINENK